MRADLVVEHFETVFNGVNAGRRIWAGDGEGLLPLDYYQMNHAARHEVVFACAAVAYEPQQLGWCVSHLLDGEAHILSRDSATSDYPPLD
jgi:hypothetical protein